MSFRDWTVLATEALKGARRTNAVQVICWMCVVVSIPSFYFATQQPPGTLQVALLVAGFIPIALFSFAYLYFLFKDPDRLHSEEFQLKSRSLDLIENKGGTIDMDRVNLTAITNPYPTQQRLIDDAHGGDSQ